MTRRNRFIMNPSAARFSILVAALLLALGTGCYWKYRNAAGDPFPQISAPQRLGSTAGVQVSKNSSEPKASSISKVSVVELFAQQLREERMFDTIIFPYTELAQATPDIILDATVIIKEKPYMAENIIKAIFTGATFLILGPVLPTHFGVVVDLSVDAKSADGRAIGSYSYRSEYDLYYTTMTPRQSKFQEWLDAAKSHAVAAVLSQMQADRAKFLPFMHAPKQLSSGFNRK